MKRFTVAEDDLNKRLDVAVAERLPEFSRAFIGKLIEQGEVLVNTQPSKPGYKLRPADKIEIAANLRRLQREPSIVLPVIYEDDDCIVINKPAGVLSHSKGMFNPEGTVASFIRSRVRGMDGERVGIVHRLDRQTSGVMIAAKHPAALSWLQSQFAKRHVKKRYVAVVSGNVKLDEAVIDMPIERSPKQPKTFRAAATGKPAITTYRVLRRFDGSTLLELLPQTGRTHQLRVHLKQIGHPIIGDTVYGGKPALRMLLHAETLELTLPSRIHKTFKAPLPAEFTAYGAA